MHIKNMALCALFASLLSVCAWGAIPAGDVVFTLQTFAVALCLLLLGGQRGSIAVLVYLLLGMAGLPVFSGFRGGIGTLMGATGGYITGFLLWALLYWLLTGLLGDAWKWPAMVAGLLLCYGFGSFWFLRVYLSGAASLGFVLLKCVVPYLLPDALKLSLAFLLAKRLKRFVY